jgi:hypothetical protein
MKDYYDTIFFLATQRNNKIDDLNRYLKNNVQNESIRD